MPNADSIRTAFLSDLSNASGETRRTRLFWANKWLAFMGNSPLADWNKIAVQEFQKRLQKEKYAASVVALAIGILKRVFDAAIKANNKEKELYDEAKEAFEQDKNREIGQINLKDPESGLKMLQIMNRPFNLVKPGNGPDWDLGKRYSLDVQRESVQHPAISMEDLKKQIDAAKGGKLEPVESAFLALASVYGMRKCELIAVEPQHIDYQAGTIWVDTHKHGEKRNQLLVPEIVLYLKRYDFKLQWNDGQLWWMFLRICRKSGVEIPKNKHESWHAYRRCTESAIMDELSGDHSLKAPADILTHRWLRWSVSKTNMVELYYNNDESDKIVAAHNPIIALWR